MWRYETPFQWGLIPAHSAEMFNLDPGILDGGPGRQRWNAPEDRMSAAPATQT
jgi:hypothetical protein